MPPGRPKFDTKLMYSPPRTWNERQLTTPNAIHQHQQRDLHSPDVMGYSSVAGLSPGKSAVQSIEGSPHKMGIVASPGRSPERHLENNTRALASPFSKVPETTELRGELDNVRMTLKMQPNTAFSYLEEV